MTESHSYQLVDNQDALKVLNRNSLRQINDWFKDMERQTANHVVWGGDILKKRQDLQLLRDTINCLDAAIAHAG